VKVQSHVFEQSCKMVNYGLYSGERHREVKDKELKFRITA